MAVRYKNLVRLDLQVGEGCGGYVAFDVEITARERLSRDEIQEFIRESVDHMADRNYRRSPGMLLEAMSEVRPEWDVAMVETWTAESNGDGRIVVLERRPPS